MRKRTDGRFEERFQINGRRYSAFGKTRNECRENAERKRKAVEAGVYTNNDRVTLDQYYEEWQGRRRRTHEVRESTSIRQDEQYRKISSFMGNRKIRQIERREVLALQESIMDDLTPRGVNNVISLLRTILKNAILDGIIERNAADGVKPLPIKEEACGTTHRALTHEEERLFFQYATKTHYYHFLRFLLLTGMRMGEGGAVRWADIDKRNGLIHVRRTLTLVPGYVFEIGEPKTRAGVRDLPLTDKILEILKEQKQAQRALFGSDILDFEQLIFTDTRGGYIKKNSVNVAIKNTLRNMTRDGIEVEPFTAHSFRDTFASRAHESGLSIKAIQILLGHADFKTTTNIYIQETPEQVREEYEKIRFAI